MAQTELQAENEALKQQLAALQERHEDLRTKYDALFKIMFGPKSERRVDETRGEPNARQGFLFLADLVEQAERLAEETGAQTGVEAKSTGKPRKRPSRRKKFPDHLPHVRTTVELSEEQRMCCGQP